MIQNEIFWKRYRCLQEDDVGSADSADSDFDFMTAEDLQELNGRSKPYKPLRRKVLQDTHHQRRRQSETLPTVPHRTERVNSSIEIRDCNRPSSPDLGSS